MHDDVIKWNHFPRYWPFVRGIHRSRWIPRTQRPVTRSFDVFFDLRLNKRLSKQPWGWWFETPPWSLWRQCNGEFIWDVLSKTGPYHMRLKYYPFHHASLLKHDIFAKQCGVSNRLYYHIYHSDSDHQQLGCLCNDLFMLTTKKTSKFFIRLLALCEVIHRSSPTNGQ